MGNKIGNKQGSWAQVGKVTNIPPFMGGLLPLPRPANKVETKRVTQEVAA